MYLVPPKERDIAYDHEKLIRFDDAKPDLIDALNTTFLPGRAANFFFQSM